MYILQDITYVGKLLVYNPKSRGPTIDPCGTPEYKADASEGIAHSIRN